MRLSFDLEIKVISSRYVAIRPPARQFIWSRPDVIVARTYTDKDRLRTENNTHAESSTNYLLST